MERHLCKSRMVIFVNTNAYIGNIRVYVYIYTHLCLCDYGRYREVQRMILSNNWYNIRYTNNGNEDF